MHVPKDFRTGWLLLLLRDGSGYGYDLRRELHARELEIDRAVMYRGLRDMEQSGLISSRWADSVAGPRRRVYSITESGRGELERIVAELRATRRAHEAFLAAYERSGERHAP
ncbi:MAG: PadR family transcriptional regulator, regulatory protein PadR [bacterium]